jgi:hypothetical protein
MMIDTAFSVPTALPPGLFYTTSGATTSLAAAMAPQSTAAAVASLAPRIARPLYQPAMSSCGSCMANNWMHDAYSVFGPLGAWGNGTYAAPAPPVVEGGHMGWYGPGGVQRSPAMYGPGGVQQSSAMYGPGGVQQSPAMYGPGGVQQSPAMYGPGGVQQSPAMYGPGGVEPMLGPGGTQVAPSVSPSGA